MLLKSRNNSLFKRSKATRLVGTLGYIDPESAFELIIMTRKKILILLIEYLKAKVVLEDYLNNSNVEIN